MRLVGSGAFWAAVGVTDPHRRRRRTRSRSSPGSSSASSSAVRAGSPWPIEPVLSGIFAIPLMLFFPLFIVFFGIGPPSKIAFGAVIGFFPIALEHDRRVRRRRPRCFLRSARSLGASRWQTFRHVYFPGALPVVRHRAAHRFLPLRSHPCSAARRSRRRPASGTRSRTRASCSRARRCTPGSCSSLADDGAAQPGPDGGGKRAVRST